MNEGKYFDLYSDEKKLPYQRLLSEKLLSKGIEANGKYVLETKNFGLPITSMLLIMRDACNNLLEIQQEADSLFNRDPDIYKPTEIEDYFQVKFDETIDTDLYNENWRIQKSIECDPNSIVSGSTVFYSAEYSFPENYHGKSLYDSISSESEETKVHKKWLKKQDQNNLEEIKIPSINIFKSMVIVLEFSYSIHERVLNSEVKKFEKYFKKKLKLPKSGKMFKSNISRRGSVIHDGNVSIRFNPINGKFEFSKDTIENIVKKGFTEACDWVNQIYKEMLKKL